MTTVISGDTGVSQVQAGSINQDDLATNVVGKGPAFRAYRSTNQNLAASNTFYKMVCNSVVFDKTNNFSGGTFTAPISGIYQFSAQAQLTATGASNGQCFLYVNGVSHTFFGGTAVGSTGAGSALVELAAGDTVDVYVKITGSAAWTVIGDSTSSYFSGFLARAA